MKTLPIAIFFLLLGNVLFAQVPIQLKNPSFEDLPQGSTIPAGWMPCEMTGETPPDIQPGSFGCTLAPADGKTYLGMVTRDNYTWESVSQELPVPLDSSVCYTFTVQLAISQNYHSISRLTGDPANYNRPVVFQLWGGYGHCDERVLLAESPVISHSDWKKYRFITRHLEPKPLKYLMLQVYYPPGKRCYPTNGNLLVDDLSAITLTDCPNYLVDTVSRSLTRKLPILKTAAALDVILEESLSSLRYTYRGDVKFEMQCGENYLGLAVLYNAYLLTVAEALKQFPDVKLVLRTKNAKSSARKPRAVYLKNYLLEAGVAESQIQVMPEEKDEQKNWKVDTEWLKATW